MFDLLIRFCIGGMYNLNKNINYVLIEGFRLSNYFIMGDYSIGMTNTKKRPRTGYI